MIKTFIVYSIFDKCLDILFDRVELAFNPIPGSCVKVIDEDGDIHILWNPRVDMIDQSDDTIRIEFERARIIFNDGDPDRTIGYHSNWFSFKSWNSREILK